MKRRCRLTVAPFTPLTRNANPMIRGLIAIGLAALATPALSASLDISFGEDSIRGEYAMAVGPQRADSVTSLDVGALYQDESGSDALLGHVGLMILGDTGAPKANIKAGVGGRAVFLDSDSGITGAAIALGGTLDGRVPDFNRIGGRAWLFYAPSVSAFDDIDKYIEFGVSVDYQLIRQASVVLGYRKLEAGLDGGPDVEIEDSAFIGLRMVF